MAGIAAGRVSLEAVEPRVQVRRLGSRRLVVSLAGDRIGADDLWLRVPYIGDRVEVFMDGQLVADQFYHGSPWDVGLRKFAKRLSGSELVFLFHPLSADAPFLSDLPPAVQARVTEQGSPFLWIGDLEVQPEYRTEVTFSP